MGYLLSVAVPTKNRYVYLKSIIDLVSEKNDDSVELVITDNSNDNSEILEYIGKLNNKNIKYYYECKKMSQMENCELAVSKCSGEFVTLLGDDDSFSYKILNVLKNTDSDFINFDCARFYWEGITHKTAQRPALSFCKKNKSMKINSIVKFNKSKKKGFTSLEKMPMVYHGIARKKVLDEMKEALGCYFPGPSPDIANAISQALMNKKCEYYSFPYIIDGVSPKSAAGLGTKHNHIGKIEEVDQLPSDCKNNWDKRVPMIWTGPTIYLESAIKSLEINKRTNEIDDINFNYFIAYFSVFHAEKKAYLKQISYKYNKLKVSVYKMLIFMKRIFIFIKNILKFKFKINKSEKWVYHCDTTKKASEIIDEYYEHKYTQK